MMKVDFEQNPTEHCASTPAYHSNVRLIIGEAALLEDAAVFCC